MLRTFLKKQGAAEDFFYYGPRTGWGYRHMKDEQSICSIVLSAGRLVGIVALDGARAGEDCLGRPFGRGPSSAQAGAHGTPALLWLDVPLDGARRERLQRRC